MPIVINDILGPDLPEPEAPRSIWADDLDGVETTDENRQQYRDDAVRQDEAVLDFLQWSGNASRLLKPLPERWGLTGPVTLPKLK